MRPTYRLSIGAVAAAVLLLPLAASAAEPSDDPVAAIREASPVLGGSWRPMAASPFGSAFAAGAWTGDELVVVDIATARAATYDPAADAWTELEPAGTAGYVWNSPWTWTGSEFVIADRGSGRVQAFDPGARTWRILPDAPFDRADGVIWADGSLVVATYDATASRGVLRTARLDLASDTWQRLANERGLVVWFPGLLWTGDGVITSAANTASRAVVFRLRPGADAWERSAPAPAKHAQVPPAWIGDELVFADDMQSDNYLDATYGLATDTWTPRDFACPVSTSATVWLDDLLFQPYLNPFVMSDPVVQPGFALDPLSGACYALTDDPVLMDYLSMSERDWPRTPALLLEAGGEVVVWSGALIGADLVVIDEPPSADRKGIIFTPTPIE